MTAADWAMLIFAGVLIVLMPIACDADHDAEQWFRTQQTLKLYGVPLGQ